MISQLVLLFSLATAAPASNGRQIVARNEDETRAFIAHAVHQILFYSACKLSPRHKAVLLIPIGSDTARYAIIQDGSMSIYSGELLIRDGEWLAGAFENGPIEQEQSKKIALHLTSLPFWALRHRDFHEIFDAPAPEPC